jgi:predicted acetyltransferase
VLGLDIRPVIDDQWSIVYWLWQAYRNDMAHVIVGSYPHADGRYKHVPLDAHPGSPAHAGYLGWQLHPQTEEPAPVGFALVDGIGAERRSISAFWTVPAVRRTGVGRELALHALAAHPGPWNIAFQHDNVGAGHFWRHVAREAWGTAWTEEERPVPDRPDVPPDHWITTVG